MTIGRWWETLRSPTRTESCDGRKRDSWGPNTCDFHVATNIKAPPKWTTRGRRALHGPFKWVSIFIKSSGQDRMKTKKDKNDFDWGSLPLPSPHGQKNHAPNNP